MRRLTVLASVLLLSACTAVPSPPYRDFEVRALPAEAPALSDTTLTARLQSAAVAAGWQLAPSLSPGVVTTASRRLGGTTSRTTAALDLIPVDDRSQDGGVSARFVRVVVRAEKRTLLGGRSKVYGLAPGLRAEVLGPLSEALAARGLVALGTPRDRDEEATDG